MIHIFCDKCGKDTTGVAYDVLIRHLHNTTPINHFDSGDPKISTNNMCLRLTLCEKCYLSFGLPNIYSANRTKKIEFRDDENKKEVFEHPNQEEADIIFKIVRASGMDSWFACFDKETEDGKLIPRPFDIEKDHFITWNEAIETIYEGMTGITDYGFTDKEIICFINLLNKEFTV